MNILYAASEAVPFCKTGGLADVAGSLPPALAEQGARTAVILPLYQRVKEQFGGQLTFRCFDYVDLAWRHAYCGLFSLEKDGVTWYFLDNEQYFGRPALYGYMDDGERFGFFSRAVVKMLDHLDFWPDVIHCNDWQTALIPIYLKDDGVREDRYRSIRTVLTIHNIEYQGRYGEQVLQDVIGLDSSYFNEGMLAYFGDVNLMKGAILASSQVTTVSPTYARELHTPFYAHGMDGVICQQDGKFCGILNGIDMDLYDPAACADLPEHYSAKDLTGKAACKAALQRSMGLQEDPYVPLIGCVSRLVGHKGFSLVTDALHDIMGLDVQMVVLGTGEWQYEEAFRSAQGQYPGRFAAHLAYSPALSNLVYAGSDLFLMPSVSEPCGLSQLIAMRFGSVPVVRETGGLKDTVPPYNKYTGEGRGFTFTNINAGDMVWVLREAAALYRSNKPAWRSLQKAGMTADFSWGPSAKQYLEVYQKAMG